MYMHDLLFYKALYPSGILHLDESCRQKTDYAAAAFEVDFFSRNQYHKKEFLPGGFKILPSTFTFALYYSESKSR